MQRMRKVCEIVVGRARERSGFIPYFSLILGIYFFNHCGLKRAMSLLWIFGHAYFDFDSPLEKCALRRLINFEPDFLNVKVNRRSC